MAPGAFSQEIVSLLVQQQLILTSFRHQDFLYYIIQQRLALKAGIYVRAT
jgi:hypothetical protein